MDSEEEKILADKLVLQRLEILKTQGAKELSKHNKMSGTRTTGIGDEDSRSASTRESFKLKIKRAVGKQDIHTKEIKTPSIVHSSQLKEENSKDLSHTILHTDENHDLIDSSLCSYPFKTYLIQAFPALQVVPSISIRR